MSKNTDLGSLVNYIKGQVTGRLNAPAYTSATAFTGVIAGYLGFDSSGNILTSAAVGVTSVSGTGTVSGLTLTGTVTTSGSLTLGGTLTLTSGNVTSALGYTPVGGSGSTNYVPLWTSTTGLGNSIIYNNSGNLGINSTTDGYTLNAIRSASTQFNDVYRGTGGFIQIFARFMQDESTKKGIAIGYSSSFSYAGIFGTQDTSSLRLGILVGSSFKAKIAMNTTTVSMDLPTSGGGLSAGELYNDGGTVKIV